MNAETIGKAGRLSLVQGALFLMAGAGLAALFLIKIVWAWTVLDLFPGAVRGVEASEPRVGNGLWVMRFVDRLAFQSPTDAPKETRLSKVAGVS